MHSRSRSLLEHALRALAVIAMVGLGISLLQPRPRTALVRTDGAVLDSLQAWTRSPADGMMVELTRAPPIIVRDWIAALRAAGTDIGWRNAGVKATALEVRTLGDPSVSFEVRAVGPPAAHISLHDEVGVMDTITTASGSATFRAASVNGMLYATAAGDTLGMARPSGFGPAKRILVLGDPEWETKFAIAALEERGWPVDARIHIAPTGTVRQGGDQQPDTSRHHAVVVLSTDLSATEASAIVRFVRQGGGLVIGAAGNRAAGLLGIAPAAALRRASVAARDTADKSVVPYVLQRLREDAVILERAGPDVRAAARRERTGLVIQLAHEATWRWRMHGDSDGMDRHRSWWTDVLVAVIPSPAGSHVSSDDDMQAPLAALVHTLSASDDREVRAGLRDLTPLFFALTVLALLGEWVSRRTRGAR